MKKLIFTLLFVFLCLSAKTFAGSSQNSAPLWGVNDVTYIFPLPDALNNHLMKVTDQGSSGALIGEVVLERLPRLNINFTNEVLIPQMRAVALRIDPCFPLPTPSDCQKQVRIVWQPIALDNNQQITTIDTALHTFYVLSDAEFSDLLQKIQNWKIKYGRVSDKQESLDIYPLWKRDKDKSKSLLEFQDIIKTFIGEKNFSRITAMALRRFDDVWAFLGFDVEKLLAKPLTIPRIEGAEVQFFTNKFNVQNDFVNSQMAPFPKLDEANLSGLVVSPNQLSEESLKKYLKNTFEIENPNSFSPENMDCVNCHIAQSSREFIKSKLTQSDYFNAEITSAYKNSEYSPENKSTKVFNTQQMRALGYFKNELAIAQRVVNESAAVAASLNVYLNTK